MELWTALSRKGKSSERQGTLLFLSLLSVVSILFLDIIVLLLLSANLCLSLFLKATFTSFAGAQGVREALPE
jgi:hypothetical protein